MFAGVLGLFVPALFFILILFLFMKTVNFFRLYLALASFAGLIGMVIGYGVLAYTGIQMKVISDEEYIQGSRSYLIQNCTDSTMYAKPTTVDGTSTGTKTPAEIEKCKTDARDQAIKERAYQSKDSMIGGGVWGSLFLIVFLLHFPFFVRSRKENE